MKKNIVLLVRGIGELMKNSNLLVRGVVLLTGIIGLLVGFGGYCVLLVFSKGRSWFLMREFYFFCSYPLLTIACLGCLFLRNWARIALLIISSFQFLSSSHYLINTIEHIGLDSSVSSLAILPGISIFVFCFFIHPKVKEQFK